MHMTNLSRVDLNLLVVLDAIVAEGGVSRAAERLNLTQPAVSHALARLRELFDDPLFVRQGRNLAPTALTKGLIEPLRQSLQALGTLIEQGESFDPALSETGFTVSMRDPMEVLILPRLMKRFARASTCARCRSAGAASRPAWPTARSMRRSTSPCRCRSASIASA
jgi:DNA-binding transcriptional LysR family regulator